MVEAIARAAAATSNRYPDPARPCFGAGSPSASRSTGRVAVANGSCEILLAGAVALCEPGAEIVFAWPSFSMYPYLAPLSGAREIRVPLDGDDEHDLDARSREITAATQIAIVCNPNNPTATHIRPRGSAPSSSRCPATSP